MAHLRDIVIRDCGWMGCHAKSKVTLYNARNAQLGDYCRKHGAQALKQFQAQEDAEFAARMERA